MTRGIEGTTAAAHAVGAIVAHGVTAGALQAIRDTPGPTGPAGAAGVGVPGGGATGQALVKASGANYDTTWGTVAAGGGGGTGGGALVPLAQIVVATDNAAVAFAAIPATYEDLLLVARCRGTNASSRDELQLQCNADTGGKHARFTQIGNATGTQISESYPTDAIRLHPMAAANAVAGAYDLVEVTIPGYARTTAQKILRSVGAGRSQDAIGNRTVSVTNGEFRSTAAIARLDLTTLAAFGGSGIAAGSVFTLYGRSAAAGTGGTTPDATATARGVVQLAGDLAGTAASPALAPTAVTPGSYTNLSATIDAKGRIVAASNGAAGGGGGATYAKHTELLVTGGAPLDQITAADLGPEPVLAGRDFIYAEVTN